MTQPTIKITQEQILIHCNDKDDNYHSDIVHEWIRTIWPTGRASVTPRKIAECDDLSVADRLRILWRLAPTSVVRLSACDSAERTLARLPTAQQDPHSITAIEVGRRHARGLATDEELTAAYDTARASWAVVRDAAVGTATARWSAWAVSRAVSPSQNESAISRIAWDALVAELISARVGKSETTEWDAAWAIEMTKELTRVIEIWGEFATEQATTITSSETHVIARRR